MIYTFKRQRHLNSHQGIIHKQLYINQTICNILNKKASKYYHAILLIHL